MVLCQPYECSIYVSTCCFFSPVFFGERTPAGVWCSASSIKAVYVSTCCCICVLILLCKCPRNATYVSSYCCRYRCGWSCRSRTATASCSYLIYYIYSCSYLIYYIYMLYICSKLGTIRSKLGAVSGAGAASAAAAALKQQLEQQQLQCRSSPSAPTRTLRELRHAASISCHISCHSTN
jgi:hypothetical protein